MLKRLSLSMVLFIAVSTIYWIFSYKPAIINPIDEKAAAQQSERIKRLNGGGGPTIEEAIRILGYDPEDFIDYD